MRLLPVLTIALAWLAPTASGAGAFVAKVWPPSVARGTTTRVTLSGKDLDGATGLWTSLPAHLIRSVAGTGDERAASFEVEVAPEAPVGLYGLRLATVHGLSNVHLFAIDDLPPVPVEAVQADAPLALPVALAGTFREAGVDRFAIDVRAGERVAFEAVANRLGKDADPLVTVRDARRRVVAERDNDGGLWFDCRFEHAFAEAGRYTVEIRDARYEGAENRAYLLRIGHFPAARAGLPSAFRPGRPASFRLAGDDSGPPFSFEPAPDRPPGGYFLEVRRPGDDASAWVPARATDLPTAIEIEPNDRPERATPVAVPAVLEGHLAGRRGSDWFVFPLRKGQAIDVRGEGRGAGSPIDLELALLDPTGREVQRVDDVLLEDAAFRFSAQVEGAHRLRVRDATGGGGPDFVYRVEVRADGPGFQVASDVAELTVPRGGSQPIPLTVTRSGYNGPIFVALVGRPDGWSLSPDVIPEGATQAVCLLTASESCPLGLATLQVEAHAGRGVLSTLARTKPMIDKQAVNVDLIKTALRDDQRHPPPSLTDRLAVLVTPPSPFSIELPEALVELARYQHAEFPIEVRRAPGFAAPVSFEARGGPIGPKKELRVQVYAELPDAAPDQNRVVGVVRSRNLAATAKTLVSIDATARVEGRRITLTRTFELDLKPAFRLAVEPARLTLAPGESARVRVSAERLKTFEGAVTITPAKQPGLIAPESIEVPAGQPGVDLVLKAAPDARPGTLRLSLPSVARVSGFEEESRGPDPITIEIKTR